MAIKHIYLGIERLPALLVAQRGTLVSALEALGTANNSSQPAYRNHWRERLDKDAAIFEAQFDEENISLDAMKERLANIFSVDVSTITATSATNAYGTAITFSHLGTDYFKMQAFGYNGSWPAWSVSGDAARAYLKANTLTWDGA